MTIKVVLHRILIEREQPVDTDGVVKKKEMQRLGLVAPEWVERDIEKQALREKASMDKGHVLSIGETAFKDYGIASPIEVGDYICFSKFGGKEVVDPDDGKTYVVINDEDVVAILTKKEPVDG